MTGSKVITKLLKFKGFRAVDWWFEERNRFIILARPYKNGCCCPECGRRGSVVQVLSPRRWRDNPVCGWTVWLEHCPREILCPTHGRVIEEIPWADRFSRITYRLEYALLKYCQIMTQKAAAELLHLPKSTLSDLLHRAVTRIREGHRIRGLKTVGIDEISYAMGHKYATLVYDLDRACVVWIGRGKGRETIDRFFTDVLSPYQKAQIKWACCDLSEAYMGAIQTHCPNATMVLDRFHIVKALNAAVDEVRKEQWRLATDSQRKVLKGLRWLLYRHSSTRSRGDTRTLKGLERGNRRIYRAWRLKDEFELFWEYRAPWAAERFLKNWMTSALRSRLESLRKFVSMLRRNLPGILAFVTRRLTNAISEGTNRIIRIVQNRASGYGTLEAFSDMIFLTVGDLNIPAQIPTRFRTL
jgi:transposase